MTTAGFIVFAVALLGVNALLVWFIAGKKRRADDGASVVLLQNQIASLTQALYEQLDRNSKEMRDSVATQMTSSQSILEHFSRELGNLQRQLADSANASKQVLGVSESLQNLQKVLTNQKQRGSIGEAGLALILENVLPPTAYELQYTFAGGEIVDAIIKTKNGHICVDAKFSLDNYNRFIAAEDAERKLICEKEFISDLKKRIEETARYIRPNDGTLSFAFMYIPAEGIYYDLLAGTVGTSGGGRSLLQYAQDKKVIIVSPMTIVAYLHTVVQGLKALQIEERAVEIMKNVDQLATHLKDYEIYHAKLGQQLSAVVNHYNASNKDFRLINKDIFRITGANPELIGDDVDRPSLEQ